MIYGKIIQFIGIVVGMLLFQKTKLKFDAEQAAATALDRTGSTFQLNTYDSGSCLFF